MAPLLNPRSEHHATGGKDQLRRPYSGHAYVPNYGHSSTLTSNSRKTIRADMACYIYSSACCCLQQVQQKMVVLSAVIEYFRQEFYDQPSHADSLGALRNELQDALSVYIDRITHWTD